MPLLLNWLPFTEECAGDAINWQNVSIGVAFVESDDADHNNAAE
jgi:hypothetical protein